MKGIIESHGGTVEKFIGDAAMVVFGVQVLHEDGALRAVRTAEEMHAALPETGIRCRIGVNRGEVVTGTQERLATAAPTSPTETVSTHGHPFSSAGKEKVRLPLWRRDLLQQAEDLGIAAHPGS